MDGHHAGHVSEVQQVVGRMAGCIPIELSAVEAVLFREIDEMFFFGEKAGKSVVGSQPKMSFIIFQNGAYHVVGQSVIGGISFKTFLPIGFDDTSIESASIAADP